MKPWTHARLFWSLCMPALLSMAPGLAEARPRIGVTLHPYYSWTVNLVGEDAEVVPVLPVGADPHTYQPQPQDLSALSSLDAVVINGQGHDAFLEPMLEAAGKKDLLRIQPSAGVPSLEGNPHSFLSILASVQQIHTLAEALGKLDPPHAAAYTERARAYTKRLRAMLARTLDQLGTLDTAKARIATVHDGYAYLFQELGLSLEAIVQPRHGIEPSAKQLADTIQRIKDAHVNILFLEMDLPSQYAKIIESETGCRLYELRHISRGAYTAEKFEVEMQENLDTIVRAVREAR